MPSTLNAKPKRLTLSQMRIFVAKSLYMLNWNDVLNFADKGNPLPDKRVEKTDCRVEGDPKPGSVPYYAEKGYRSQFQRRALQSL